MRLRTLIPIALLCVISAALGGTTIFLTIKVAHLKLQITFADEQIGTFLATKDQVYKSQLSPEEAIAYVSWYYGPGSKLPSGSTASTMVERVRADVLHEIHRYEDSRSLSRNGATVQQ